MVMMIGRRWRSAVQTIISDRWTAWDQWNGLNVGFVRLLRLGIDGFQSNGVAVRALFAVCLRIRSKAMRKCLAPEMDLFMGGAQLIGLYRSIL